VDGLTQDLRHALRLIRKNPGFAAFVALTLGLGIGANASIFSLLDQVLVRRLPVRDPEQLVLLNGPGPNVGWITNSSSVLSTFSHPMFEDFRDRNQVFSGVLARYPTSLQVALEDGTEEVDASLVSGTFFQVLGVGASLGRVFTSDDDRTPGGHPIAVLSHGYWVRRFGGDPGVIGRAIRINGQPLNVVGVAESGFHGIQLGRSAELFVPCMMKPRITPTWNGIGERRVMWLEVMARLRPGVTVEQAASAMNVLYRQILEAEAKELAGRPESFLKRFVEKKLEVLPGAQGAPELQSQLRTPLVVLMAMVGLVILIACANVANLLLARASSRQQEIAVRLALGARRGHLARQLLAESLVLSLLGAVAGLLLAAWTTGVLLRALPFEGVAQTLSADPDWRVATFALGLALVTALLVGLAPALQATRPDLASTLKQHAAAVAGGQQPLRFRKGLVIAQVALSALLLVGAGLFSRSLVNLRSLDPGFAKEGLLSFSVDPIHGGRSLDQSLLLYFRLRERLQEIPGVDSVSMTTEPLMTDSHDISTVAVEGYVPQEGENMNPDVNGVGPDLFATLGMPLLAGRDIDERDGAAAPKVAVVNETFARYFFGSRSPIGRHFGWGRSDPLQIEIVGVVRDAKFGNLRDSVPRFVYVPYAQNRDLGALTFYVRGQGGVAALSAAVREAVREVDPALPVVDLRTMRATIDESLFVDRIVAGLSAAFGLLATLLAAVGLYAVMSFAVARRTREIGVRVALGAGRARVLRLVLSEVALLSAIGMAIGLPGGWGMGRLLESRLFGLTAFDPATLATVALVLAATTLVAGVLPALRATRVDPATALRQQ